MENSLKIEASILFARAYDLKQQSTFQQMQGAGPLVEDMGSFLVKLAERVDALTPGGVG